jgi:hypothetical protein
MKTIFLNATMLILTMQIMVKGQTQGNKVNNFNTDKVKIRWEEPQKAKAKHNIPMVLGTEKKLEKYTKVNTNDYGNININALNINDLKRKAEELMNETTILTNNALKFTNDNRIKQLEVVKTLQNEAYLNLKKAIELSFQNALAEYNFNKIEFLSLLKSANEINDVVEFCISKQAEAEYELTLAKEMMQESYAMPNLGAMVGTMSNAEEKEIEALKMQNQAIEKLKTIVVNNNNTISNLVVAK